MNRLTHALQVIEFIREIDQLKGVERRIKNLDNQRYENSAEHSWQVALLALGLIEALEADVDTNKVVQMLLLHDIVEIDTGDVFAYDAGHDNYQNELKAAKRIFGVLPEPTASKWLNVWIEFETSQTPEAIFAKAMDRMMPILLNLKNNGQSWREHGICAEQVFQKNAIVEQVSPALWHEIKSQVEHVLSSEIVD